MYIYVRKKGQSPDCDKQGADCCGKDPESGGKGSDCGEKGPDCDGLCPDSNGQGQLKTNMHEDPGPERLRYTDIANRTCNFECVKQEKEPDWFTGLVKVVLVETSRCEYLRRMWWAGLIGLSYLMIGAASTMVFFFSLAMILPVYENVHVFLCTAGFQLLVPLGMLMICDLNGPSIPLTVMCKRCNHLLLQMAGLGCGITGAILVLCFGKAQSIKETLNAHFFSGIFACLLTVLAAIFGPFIMFTMKPNCCSEFFGPIHFTLGASGFLASSVCFMTGIMKPSFTKWLPLPEILYFLVSFCAIYTFIIFLTPIIRCLSCNKPQN